MPLADDLALLEEAVREAGDLALEHFRSGVKQWRKKDGTPVSEADMAVDRLLEQRLLGARPDYGWLSEEAEIRRGAASDPTFIVDPIDGTRAFLDGGEGWCVAVALVVEGRPVAAAVMAPVTGEFYTAAAGQGATLDGVRLRSTRCVDIAGCSIIAGPSVFKSERWGTPWPKVRAGTTTSLVLRLCAVASGRFDAAVALGAKSDWDLAAGDLMVHEAGGRVSDLSGELLAYGRIETRKAGVVAAGPLLHGPLIDLTRTFKG